MKNKHRENGNIVIQIIEIRSQKAQQARWNVQLVQACMEREKKIDKKNDDDKCPLCAKEESWEHVALRDKSKKKRED